MDKDTSNKNLFHVLILFGLFVAVLSGWMLVAVVLDKQDSPNVVTTVEREQQFPDSVVVDTEPADVNEDVDASVEVGDVEDEEESSNTLEASVEVQ